MKTKSFLLSLALVASFLSVKNLTFAATPGAANATADTATQAERELNEKLARLWADRPEYAPLLQSKATPDRPARVTSAISPEFPKTARRAGIKGTILVSFFVGEDGRVEAARVLESPDEKLNKPAVAAILKWKFVPAMRGDKPVKASVVVPMVVQ